MTDKTLALLINQVASTNSRLGLGLTSKRAVDAKRAVSDLKKYIADNYIRKEL